MAVHFESDPNVTVVEGDRSVELVTQKLEITDAGVLIMTRGGVMGGANDVELAYESIDAVDYRGEYVFELVIETARNTYTVRNVSPDEDEMRDMVGFIDNRAAQARASTGRSRSAADGLGAAGSGSRSGSAGRAGANGEPSRSSAGANGSNGAADTDPSATSNGGSDDGDVDEQLRRFAQLKEDGVITEEEFQRKKEELLGL
jgi:hypothetical protein